MRGKRMCIPNIIWTILYYIIGFIWVLSVALPHKSVVQARYNSSKMNSISQNSHNSIIKKKKQKIGITPKQLFGYTLH